MNVGDQVQWTKVSQRRGVITMTLKEGVILDIDNEMAKVRSGRSTCMVTLDKLRGSKEKSEITEVIEAMRRGAGLSS